MVRIRNLLPFVACLVLVHPALATLGEFEMRVVRGSTSISLPVYLYYGTDLTIPIRSCIVEAGEEPTDVNFHCDIFDEPYYYGEPSDSTPSWRMIIPGDYTLRVGNLCISLTILEFLQSEGVERDFQLKYDDSTQHFSVLRGNRAIVGDLPEVWDPPMTSTVSLDQQLSTGNTVGDMFHVFSDGFEISTEQTKQTLAATYQSEQTFRADRVIHDGEKYNNWNALDDVTNHHRFEINNFELSITSYLKSIAGSVTIRTELLDFPGQQADSVGFKDPWLADYHDPQYNGALRNQGLSAQCKSRRTPFLPDVGTSYAGDVYLGVFLNQQIIQGKAYYSVGASPTHVSNGTPLQFVGWSGDDNAITFQDANACTTGVMFKLEGATASARYKGHLFSSSGGFASNNQRKVAVTTSGVYCIVYTSANRIWFTRHSGGSATPEVEVSAGSAYALNTLPSICSNGDIINIVWQSTDTVHYELPEGYYSNIHLRSYNAYSNNWGSVETIYSTVVPTQDFGLSPAIDASALWNDGENDAKLVVWRDYDRL